MKLLRKVLGLNRIYSHKTIAGMLFDYALLLLLIQLASFFVPYDKAAIRSIGFIVWSIFVWRSFIKFQLVRNRLKNVRHTTSTTGLLTLFPTTAVGKSTKSGLDQNQSFKTIAEKDGWKLYESQLDVYRKTKYGTYLHKRLFHTIFEGTLLRPLPNIVFDSSRAKGNQFKYAYLQSQRLSLEGNFDSSFTVYAPNNYKIDTLSFITPEVMLAFQEAHDYDIELKDNRVFMFGPLLLDAQDDDTMIAKGERLMKELNDNIDTYKDSWLTGKESRTETTRYARTLLNSPVKPAVGLALSLIAGLLLLLGRLRYGAEWLTSSSPVTIVIFFVVVNSIGLYTVLRDNKKANADFVKQVGVSS